MPASTSALDRTAAVDCWDKCIYPRADPLLINSKLPGKPVTALDSAPYILIRLRGPQRQGHVLSSFCLWYIILIANTCRGIIIIPTSYIRTESLKDQESCPRLHSWHSTRIALLNLKKKILCLLFLTVPGIE